MQSIPLRRSCHKRDIPCLRRVESTSTRQTEALRGIAYAIGVTRVQSITKLSINVTFVFVHSGEYVPHILLVPIPYLLVRQSLLRCNTAPFDEKR